MNIQNSVVLILASLILFSGCNISGSSDRKSTNSQSNVSEPLTLADSQSKGHPYILFSDMTSAPNRGWSSAEPNKGAAITIWGRGFGNIRGNSYITVSGISLKSESDYAVWGESWPTPFWQKITFYLNSSMLEGTTSITVTVNDKKSNPLPFTIRDGIIYFVQGSGVMGNGTLESPYSHIRSLQDKYKNCLPGDVFYYRAGTYTELVGDYGQAVLALRGTDNGYVYGTETHPISIIAYPGEKPKISLQDPVTGRKTGLSLQSHYYVVSGFTFDTGHCAASLGNYSRFVGNDVVALKALYFAGSGSIVTSGSGAKVYGNAIHGGRSANRLDHAVYFSGAPVEEGSFLGWNYIYDNDFGRGPEIAVNHQDDRVPSREYVKSHFVFNNIVDTGPQRATIINVYDLSWDQGESHQPEPIYIYNNIFLNGGTLDLVNQNQVGWASALIAGRDHSRIYNNVLYNTSYIGFTVGRVLDGSFSTEILNNIIHFDTDIPITRNDFFYISDGSVSGTSTMKDNFFYKRGALSVVNSYPGAEKNPLDTVLNSVDVDPRLVNPDNLNFSVDSGSSYKELPLQDLLPANAPEAISMQMDLQL